MSAQNHVTNHADPLLRRVVVTGMGIISPLGVGVATNTAGLRAGNDRAHPIEGVDPLCLRGRLVCQVPETDLAEETADCPCWWDRTTRLLKVALDEALLRSGSGKDLPNGLNLVLGTTTGGLNSGMKYHLDFLGGAKGRTRNLLDYLAFSHPSALLSVLKRNLRPLVVSNACASGTSALGLAYRMVKYGHAETVLAAGVDPVSAFTFWGFNALRLVTRERCRPFDRDRSGLVLGEGAAVFVLETAERARARGAPTVGEVLGYGEKNDAYHPTRPHPEGDGAFRAMRQALGEAHVSPGQLGYVNAHGTGTLANDLAEARALQMLLGENVQSIPVSSTKGSVGHCLGAAGALEAAFTLIALGHGFAPPTVNLEQPDPDIGLNLVGQELRELNGCLGLSNSFGFGGMNASVLLSAGDVAP